MKIGDKVRISYPIPTIADKHKVDPRPLTWEGIIVGFDDAGRPNLKEAVNIFNPESKIDGIMGGYNPRIILKL